MNNNTFANKVVSVLLLLAALPVAILDLDITCFAVMSMVAIPLFFAKRNYIFM